MTMKIYLAGPFFNPKQIETIEAIENEFDKYGFDYFFGSANCVNVVCVD